MKKAPVDKQAKVTDTFETLIALKKVSQCKAMIIPNVIKRKRIFGETLKSTFFQIINIKTKPTAISMRYQTKGNASSEINAPKMAVKPHIKTMS